MKRVLVALLAISMAAGVLTGCGSKGSEKTFTVGFDAEFPPYGYRDDYGEYVGFDLDLAAEVCKRQGCELVKQPIDWDSKDMELSSGSIDCIWNGFTLNGREREYTWSKAYIDNSQVVIVKSGSGIKKLEDLKGKVVIVQADSSALAAFTGEDATEENLALAAQFKTLQQVSDYNSAFMNLESGSADAVCMDMGVAKYQLEQRGNKFTMLDETVSSEQYGIGFKLGNTALRDVVHEQIGTGNRISWLIATIPCILFAIFGVSSFIVLTRIMSGVVVLVSIMLVLTYGKSRKKAGNSPICGVFGTVYFQVLIKKTTKKSAIGALIPLS